MTDDLQILMFMEDEREERDALSMRQRERPRIPATLELAIERLIGGEWWARWIRFEIPWHDEHGRPCRVPCAWMFELYGVTVAIGVNRDGNGNGSVLESHVTYADIGRLPGTLLETLSQVADVALSDPSRYELDNRRLEDCLVSERTVTCSERELCCLPL